MPTVSETAEYFVVGGALRAEHPCYVVRAVDRELRLAIRDRGLYCVLGPPGVGKSSLAVRAAAALRREGGAAAVVSAAHVAGDSRKLALAVARDFGLETAAERWWQSQSLPDDASRLAAFFREVVLAGGTSAFTVFVDDVEAALATPLGADVLGAIALCNLRRDSDAEYRRLAFVVLGTASRRELAGRDASSPFAAAMVAEPRDFSLEEAYRLTAGFGGARELTQALMDRLCTWTSGHPYLTQLVARGVARKGGRLEDVERVVREQLLAPGAAESEPLLARLRDDLRASTPAARRASRLLRKASAGGRVAAPSDARVLEVLHSSGAAVVDADGRLAPRNRIVRELSAAGWLERSRRAWRIAAVAAVVLALGAAGALWYTQYLPQEDVATLSGRDADLADVSSAYERLHALPGFDVRADELFGAALERLSGEAATFADASAVDAKLRTLSGRESAADRLLAEFWLRRARAAANAEQRDAALLLALRAAELPSPQATAAAAYARELGGDDYLDLERSMRLATPPVAWRMVFDQRALVTIDADEQLARVPFGAAVDGDESAAPVPITALVHEALRRDLVVDGEGSAGELELSLTLEHPAGPELLVTLTAPSGAQAVVVVPNSASGALETFVFPAAPGAALAALADEARAGAWRLTVVDRSLGNAGTLVGWQLRFGDDVFADTPTEPLAIPDPQRTTAVTRTLDGAFVIARPRQPGAIGTAAFWNVDTRRLVQDFTLPGVPQTVAVNATGERLVAATAQVATVFDTVTGAVAARAATDTEFTLPPVFSSDGAYFAIAERVADAPPLFSVLRAADGALVSSFEGIAAALRWQLGPGARWLAVTRDDGSVGVVETGRGRVVAELTGEREIVRLMPLGDGAAVLTVDSSGELVVHALATGASPRRVGATTDASSVSVTADGRLVSFAADGAAAVVATSTGAVVQRARHATGGLVLGTQLARDGSALVTFGTDMLRLWNVRAPSVGAVVGEPAVTALALGRGGGRAAVGFASGQLEIVAAADLATVAAASRLAYFGHRGPITAIAFAERAGMVATGGSDGIVRLWNAASGEPTGIVMQPDDAPIERVALAEDASVVVVLTGDKLRVARAADGRVVEEQTLDAAVDALTVAPDGATFALGTAPGEVALIGADGRRVWNAKAAGGIAALAFGDGVLAVGDRQGGVQLLRLDDGAPTGQSLALPQAVQWLDWNDDHAFLLVATRDWAHVAANGGGPLASLQARLVVPPAAVLAVGAGTSLVTAARDAAGSWVTTQLDLVALPAPAPEAALPQRDWAAALGIRLDAAGAAGPLDP